MKNTILTAVRPTGKLHIGHYVGALREIVKLQNTAEYDEFYVMIADAQALTDNAGNPQKVRDNILEVMLDYLAVGLDPQKVTIFVQSQVPALFEMTSYYMNLVTLPRLLRNPTVKGEIQLRGFEQTGLPVGFACYPISQASDITALKANIIPVGEDQEPMIEQTREIVKAFNRTYGADVLVPCKAVLPQNSESRRLPGIDGNAKMGKSLGNCIYLSDDAETIKKKVNMIKTAPRLLQEPGEVEDSVLFTYLRAFCKDEHFAQYYPEFANLTQLEESYKKGGIGDGRVKKFLNDVLQQTLQPIREKREQLKNNIPQILQILKDGTQKANKKASQTLHQIKDAMGIEYFFDDSFLNEQTQKFKN